MTDTLASYVRMLGPRDHLRFPELARIGACLDAFEHAAPSLNRLLEALGEQANHVTLARPLEAGGFGYVHFGSQLALDAGFDMSGKRTQDFDARTRHHIESSFSRVLEGGEPLCTIMAAAPGASVHSWQRVVYRLMLEDGPHVLALVKPLRRSLDAIHARREGAAVCVVPLGIDTQDQCFVIKSSEQLERYLPGEDISPIAGFLTCLEVPRTLPPVGTLMTTTTMQLEGGPNGAISLIIDVVHGFTAPFLVVINATGSTSTNEELRVTAHMLKTSFEVGRLGSWINRDPQGGEIVVAPELARLLDIPTGPRGNVPLALVRQRYLGTLALEVDKAVKTCWQTGENYVIEGQTRRGDGQVLWVRISGSPMRDEAGRITSLFGILQDITAEQSAKRQVQASEDRFRDFATAAGDWCWETDEEHRFTDLTDGIESAGNFNQSQFIGMTRRDMPVIHEDKGSIEAHFEDLEARRPFRDLKYRLRDAMTGELVTIKVSGKPHFAPDGHFLGYRGIASNVTDRVRAELDHQERQLTLRSAQSLVGLGYWITDLSSGRTRWSHEILGLLDLQPQGADTAPSDRLIEAADLNVRSLLKNVHPEDRRKLVQALGAVIAGENPAPVDLRYFRNHSAAATHLRVQMRREPASDISPERLLGVVQDMSGLKSVQAELEKRTATLDEAQAMGGMGDWQYDLASRALTWSSQLYAILRVDRERFTPSERTVGDICPASDAQLIASEHELVLREGLSSRIDVQARRGDGTLGYYSMVTKPTFNSRGAISGMFGTVQDITERKHTEKQLRMLAYYDPLTGLANRALFSRELQATMTRVHEKGGSAALLLLDLDHFKEVNDTLGHAAGDELLCRVARGLKEMFDERGFVARLGGDEFAVIINDYASVNCLNKKAQSIVSRLSGVLKLKRGEVVTGTSLGIALIPQDGGNAEEALRHADLALYMAKGEGRGKALFFEPAMSRSMQARLHMARDLRAAVEAGTLETRYQGQIDLHSGKVVGFETLVRWKHPVRGYISPAEFIPVAESSSLICDIGLWVLRDACKTARGWLDAGEPERMISVNVSAAQIWQSDFEDDVLRIVAQTNYPPHLLCLELTESAFADHGEGRVQEVLVRLKAAGIRLALDDFGTGYSSLGYLNELPFDELKIDRCFVSGVHKSPEKARLLQGIIALGKGLGMRVVGEGAEAAGEIDLLRAFNCDMVQGFAYMRPEMAQDALACADQIEFKLAEEAAALGEMDVDVDLRRVG